MSKRSKKHHHRKAAPQFSVHMENLIELRDANPQAYARLGEGPNRAVEKYENEKLASAFEPRDGMERLLDLKERLPSVFARFSDETKRRVELYLEHKHAFELVNNLILHDRTP